MSDLKWLSVWCRAFKVNFGDLVADFTLDHEGSDAEAESESEPETVSNYSFVKHKSNILILKICLKIALVYSVYLMVGCRTF